MTHSPADDPEEQGLRSQALWCAVIEQALKDGYHWWFRLDNLSFKTVCDRAGLNPEAVCDRLRRMEALPRPVGYSHSTDTRLAERRRRRERGRVAAASAAG